MSTCDGRILTQRNSFRRYRGFLAFSMLITSQVFAADCALLTGSNEYDDGPVRQGFVQRDHTVESTEILSTLRNRSIA